MADIDLKQLLELAENGKGCDIETLFRSAQASFVEEAQSIHELGEMSKTLQATGTDMPRLEVEINEQNTKLDGNDGKLFDVYLSRHTKTLNDRFFGEGAFFQPTNENHSKADVVWFRCSNWPVRFENDK